MISQSECRWQVAGGRWHSWDLDVDQRRGPTCRGCGIQMVARNTLGPKHAPTPPSTPARASTSCSACRALSLQAISELIDAIGCLALLPRSLPPLRRQLPVRLAAITLSTSPSTPDTQHPTPWPAPAEKASSSLTPRHHFTLATTAWIVQGRQPRPL